MTNNEYNVTEKERKDTYDKLFGSGNNIFSESGFDEMQKARNYEIGFKIFRVFFWAAYLIATAVMAAAMVLETTAVLVIGIVFTAVCDLFLPFVCGKGLLAGSYEY